MSGSEASLGNGDHMSTKNHRMSGGFRADPPIEDQMKQLKKCFADLADIITESTSETKQDESKVEIGFQECSEELEENIHKLFCDTWKTIRSAQRREDSHVVSALKVQLQRQVTRISRSINKIRQLEIQVLQIAYENAGEVSIGESMLFSTHKLIQTLSIILIEDLCEMAQKAFEKDMEFALVLYGSAFDEISNFGNGLCEIHQALCEAILGLHEAGVLNEDDTKLNMTTTSEMIRNSRSAVFPITLQLFKTVYNLYEEGDDENMFFDVEKLYRSRIITYQSFCNSIDKCDDTYVDFLSSENQITADNLIAELNKLWAFSSIKRWYVQCDAIGDLIVNFLVERADCRDKTLKNVDIANPYCVSIQYNDRDVAETLKELLIAQLEQQISDLEKMRRFQLKTLSKPPSPDACDEYVAACKSLSHDMQEKAVDLLKAISFGREGDFYKDDYAEEDEQGEEDVSVFLEYDTEESTNIFNHLCDIKALIDKVYTTVGDTSLLDDYTSTKGSMISSSKRSVSIASGVSSSSAFTTASKAERARIMKHMSPEQIKQCHCLEDALCATYIQLFTSVNGAIVAAIRSKKYNEAMDMNQRLREYMAEYTNNLHASKKRALAIMDIEGMKEADERLKELEGKKEDVVLEKCIIKSLTDLIRSMIMNYERNCEEIEDEYNESVEMERRVLDKKSCDLERKVHMPNLVVLEKKCRIACQKEEVRTKQLPELEDQIRSLAAAGDYKKAQKLMDGLRSQRETDRKLRLEAIEKKFNKERQQMLELQQRDLQILEDSFTQKLEEYRVKHEKALKETRDTLGSAISLSHQRHVQFALKILQLNAKGKADLATRFSNSVKSVLKEYELDEKIFRA